MNVPTFTPSERDILVTLDYEQCNVTVALYGTPMTEYDEFVEVTENVLRHTFGRGAHVTKWHTATIKEV